MLGQAIIKNLSQNPDIEAISVSRGLDSPDYRISELKDVFVLIDQIKPTYVINCIGVIKPYIDAQSDSILNAIKVNSVFPHELAIHSEKANVKIIQIATDCVFSGRIGGYSETAEPDPTDIYGMSKYLGEINSNNSMNIRCSIIGPNQYSNTSLFNWVSGLKDNSSVPGYTNHYWNGVTTKVFAEVVERIMNSNLFQAGTFHLVPSGSVTKFELVKIIASYQKKSGLNVLEVESKTFIDRRLSTNNPVFNRALWGVSKDTDIPTIAAMNF